ncbi:MAG: DUF3131 domain-containing protein [Elusimicrobia bacterium]|nr:DUF3131 domain-containing protein [Elusimicrobiota bacterium]
MTFFLGFCSFLPSEPLQENVGISYTVLPILISDFSDGQMKTHVGDGAMGVWTLDPSDLNQSCKTSIVSSTDLGDSKTCLAIDYKVTSDPPQRSKVGLWMLLGGLDLREHNTLEIEMKGDAKIGHPRSLRLELKRAHPQKPNELISASATVEGVGPEWKVFKVPFSKMNGITDWYPIQELVLTFVDRLSDRQQGRIYLSRIEVKKEGEERAWTGEHFARSVPKPSDQLEGQSRAEFLLQRLHGFPVETSPQKKFPKETRPFLQTVAQDTWKYFEYLVDRETGLVLDNIQVSTPVAMGENTRVGDYTNITNVGLYFLTLPAAEDLGLISRQESEKRALHTLKTLAELERFKGFYYNYYDTTTKERTTHFISSVDTGWLVAGLIMLRNSYAGEVAQRATELIESMNLGFFYDPVERELYHGYYTNIGAYSEYHYGVFFTEARVTSFIGVSKGDIPEEHWFSVERTFPEQWNWQSQKPQNRVVAETLGHRYFMGHYLWEDKPVVPSWGGSSFEALMPPLVLDEVRLSPKGWGLNDLRHAQAQVEYAKKKGYPVWGMSPSSDTRGGYGEFGVKLMGLKGYPDGVVTPHATLIALPFLRDQSVENLRNLLEKYPALYGEYGFYDAVNPRDGAIAFRYLALDQAMSFLGLAHALQPGKLHKRFHSDPITKNGEKLLKSENPLPLK